jgi:hypothetical protein
LSISGPSLRIDALFGDRLFGADKLAERDQSPGPPGDLERHQPLQVRARSAVEPQGQGHVFFFRVGVEQPGFVSG